MPPVLTLLADPRFKQANEEYINALEDYRKGDYGDCLTKCCSSFESVMKIICDEKKWNYSQNDTAAKLIPNVVSNSGLDKFFEQPLLLIATMRNRLSTAHGGGTQSKNVEAHTAQFAVNTTGSAILMLVSASGI